MERRAFFKRLTTGAAGGLVALAPQFPEATTLDDLPKVWMKFVHTGHLVWWTGWKGDAGNATLVSQWTAWPAPMLQQAAGPFDPDPWSRGLYVCVPPGTEGEYHKGDTFDIAVRDPKHIFTVDTPNAVQFAAVAQGRERILRLVEERIRQWPVRPAEVSAASDWLRTERL